MKHIPSGRLERWYGSEYLNMVSLAMCNPVAKWYGPEHIPVAGATGMGPRAHVLATRDGDFVGHIPGGRFGSYMDFMADKAGQLWRASRRQQFSQLNTGFSGIADLLAAVRTRRQYLQFSKNTTINGTAQSFDLWTMGAQPPAGAAGAAAPGGTAHTKANTGAMSFENAVSGETMHAIQSVVIPLHTSDAVTKNFLLYDRLFSVAKTMNSTGTEAVTGVPTRYQSTTQGADNSAEGNFLFIANPTTVLPATAHNWTVCTYTDQSGNAGATLPSVTGISACAVHRLDMPVNQWFCPLASGDTGIQQLDQMQCSAAVATGTIHFVIGHPLCWVPMQYGGGFAQTVLDGVLSAFNLGRIFDDACLALLHAVDTGANFYTCSGHVQIAAS